MVTVDLGACERFVWDLRRSNLIDRGQLDQLIGEFLGQHPGTEPPALADHLVEQGALTRFQADRVLQGKIDGFILGPYTLIDTLGAGSMGTVYKAQSRTDERWYAVKVLPRRSMWNVRLARRKVRAFEGIKHQAVVPFVDVGTAGSTHYLAWPLVEGETLDQLVQRKGKLSAAEAANFALQTAEGLEACHQQGLFHGLIKPSNLLITSENQVRILDFGIGCLLAESDGESLVDTMSTANAISSGLDCASPESITDPTKLTPLGDQYSLGCVLYFCLTGRYPFQDSTTAEKMMAHQLKQPVPILSLNPAVPPGLVAVVERLMKKSPEARFGSAAEAAQALWPWAVAAVEPEEAPTPTDRLGPHDRVSRPMLPSGSFMRYRPARTTTGPIMPAKASGVILPNRRTVHGHAAVKVDQDEAKARCSFPRTDDSLSPSANPASTDQPRPLTWEERLGPVGLGVCAFLICLLVWLLSRNLF